jgi:hypothetical protein
LGESSSGLVRAIISAAPLSSNYAEPVSHRHRGDRNRAVRLTAGNLYAYYKAEGYVIVMQNINREPCRRLRRADRRSAELSLHAGG